MLQIPDGISPVEAQAVLNPFAGEWLEKQRRGDEISRVLECDDALREFESRNMPFLGPLVRAVAYDRIYPFQEIKGFVWTRDPRRPVCMRGAQRGMIAAHSNSTWEARNGYCSAIIRRYLKMGKFTIIDFVEMRKMLDKLESGVVRKHGPNQYKGFSPSKELCMVGGRFVHLDNHQREYINKLDTIIKKTKKLDAMRQRADASET